jgi:hypothetical protein
LNCERIRINGSRYKWQTLQTTILTSTLPLFVQLLKKSARCSSVNLRNCQSNGLIMWFIALLKMSIYLSKS